MSSNSTSSNAPLSNQESFYVGIALHDILYGILLCFYFETMHIFLSRKRTPRKYDAFYAVFSSAMLLFITIWVAFNGILSEDEWLLYQYFPAGPIAYEDRPTSGPYVGVITSIAVILQLMTDGLMMYRCQMIWESLRAIIIPFILWLATLVFGILLVWACSTTDTNVFGGNAARLVLVYYTISVFLLMTLTCMICYRLVLHARSIKKNLGDGEERVAPHLGIIMLFIESVLPSTLTGIAFLVSFGVGSLAEIGLLHVYTAMMCISAQMLILHVAEGTAWHKDSMRPLSPMKFSSRCGETSGSAQTDGSIR
ncbi:hypothetical protein OG21DRAFT_1511036 [Imleria badia]|nr:hypothetical protein OG21DRAFT_1511036 [Imleria badia]